MLGQHYIYKCLTNKYTTTTMRLFLGGLFIWASWDKLIHPQEFVKVVSNYKLLPDPLINLCAVILPWIEFVAGLLLIIGFQIRSSSLIILSLLGIFILAIGINLVRGLNIECGCFKTKGGRGIALTTLFGDLSLFALGLAVFFYAKGFLGIDSIFKQRDL